MKFRFSIHSCSEIQTCCEFLIRRWQLSEYFQFYLQLYTEEYFTNLIKYTSHAKDSFGLQASYVSNQMYLLFWDKTLPFNPEKGTSDGLGTRLLTQLFPYKYRTLSGINFFWVELLK